MVLKYHLTYDESQGPVTIITRNEPNPYYTI